MTEVEFSRQLSELTTTAKALNEESNSLNAVIKQFEEKLRAINLGLEVWVSDDPLEKRDATEEDTKPYVSAEWRQELGFVKSEPAWCLAVREALYGYEYPDRSGHRRLSYANSPVRLLESSRKTRIEAIKRFPELVRVMNEEARGAVQAIEDAKKLIK